MAQKKRGPGRPKWVSRRVEVRMSPGDEAALAEWKANCGETEDGRAYRRAIVAVNIMRKMVMSVALTALCESEGLLNEHERESKDLKETER